MSNNTTTTVIELSRDYGLVLLASTAIISQYFVTPLIVIGPVRKRIFNKDYLNKNFGQVHRKEIGGDVPVLGYPDLGNGRFSQLLSYKDWMALNSAYRIHLNFGEGIGIIVPFTLIASLKFPRTAAYLALGYFVSRIIYAVGYTKKPDARRASFWSIACITCAMGTLAAFTGWKVFRK